MSIRCKMKCSEVVQHKTEGKVTREDVRLDVVVADSKENAIWSKYTPTGNFQFSVTNEECFGKIIAGKTYYIDLNECE